jgi:hypothetical protein
LSGFARTLFAFDRNATAENSTKGRPGAKIRDERICIRSVQVIKSPQVTGKTTVENQASRKFTNGHASVHAEVVGNIGRSAGL